MPDHRPAHMTTSLLNMPTPKFEGPAHSLYGPRGPVQSHNTGRRRTSEPPMSIEHFVQDAIARVADLSPKQRLALRNEVMRMTRDISFVRLIARQTHGPYSEAAVQDEGRVL